MQITQSGPQPQFKPGTFKLQSISANQATMFLCLKLCLTKKNVCVDQEWTIAHSKSVLCSRFLGEEMLKAFDDNFNLNS